MASSVPDQKYLGRLLVGLGKISSARSVDAREYRGDERDDATIKRVQKLMDAKVKGKLPKCLFKPQSKWCAHGIFIAFSRWSSNVFRPVPAPPPDA